LGIRHSSFFRHSSLGIRHSFIIPMPLDLDSPAVAKTVQLLGFELDSWQRTALESPHRRLLLNCSRQAGKSTVVALRALLEALYYSATRVLLVSRSQRQSGELFRLVTDFYDRIGAIFLKRRTRQELELTNGSRIVSVPCREDTIRGFARIHLLIIDEAARVPDDLYRAVRPMLAVSRGRLICLSTPYGKRGFFYDAWARGGDDWQRIEVPAERIPRITVDFLAEERRALGESWFRQEYGCSFEALEGLVYPDFARCVVPGPAPSGGRRVGGIDFGFRNPFAALWGVLDRDGALWLTNEHYQRQRPLSEHARHLPREVTWYVDPAGANERCELIHAGFTVYKGDNALRPGIAAVSARLENGTLNVMTGRCPNLLAEAELYRYSDHQEAETPLDEHNHALAALRYLVSRLDAGQLARGPRPTPTEAPAASEPWLRVGNEQLWKPLSQ
jgi:hypothetical protein